MFDVQVCTDCDEWDSHLLSMGAHPLQLWAWGEIKSRHHWDAVRVLVRSGGEVIGACQFLVRSVKGLPVLAYAPRGPVWQDGAGTGVLRALASWGRRNLSGFVLLIEPDVETLPADTPFKPGKRSILMSHTLIMDLSPDEEQILAGVSKTYRKNLRRVQRDKTVEVRRIADSHAVQDVLDIYRLTAHRDGFALHSDQYYQDVFALMGEHGVLYGAYAQDGELLSFLWNVESATTAFELYGGMTERGAQLRANFPLKWMAICEAKERGLTRYDMNGLLNDGISRFKKGWVHDHEADDLAGTFELPLSPLYRPANLALSIVSRVRKSRR